MEEEKKATAGVEWVENAPAAPRRRSRKKSAAKGKPKKARRPGRAEAAAGCERCPGDPRRNCTCTPAGT